MIVTRFAPSPTGFLHLGNAFAALVAFEAAKEACGRFLLRIEDIDSARCQSEFERAIYEDLAWLGLSWERPVRRQSEHFADYRSALAKLEERGVVYACFCTRKDIVEEIQRMGLAPRGPQGPVYPGTCRALPPLARAEKMAQGIPYALRLDVARATALAGRELFFDEKGLGPCGESGRQRAVPGLLGDIVLARKETPASYHLAVVVDDARQGVTLVTRGNDLFPATHVQRLLQALLDLPTPGYAHHRLIVDAAGKKLAKSTQAPPISALRASGKSAGDIRRMLGFEA